MIDVLNEIVAAPPDVATVSPAAPVLPVTAGQAARQGDLVFVPAKPADVARWRPSNLRDLVRGARVSHSLAAGANASLFVDESGTVVGLSVSGDGAVVTHEEHHHLTFAPGDWCVLRQRSVTAAGAVVNQDD